MADITSTIKRKAVFRLEVTTTNLKMTTEEWRKFVAGAVLAAEQGMNQSGVIRAHIFEWDWNDESSE